MWIEQPASQTGEWVERQLTGLNGPGVAFELVDLDGDGSIQVAAAQVCAPPVALALITI